MELSIGLGPGRDTVEHARIAESLGYRRCWLYDSPALYDDVWVALARVAEATERIELGPAVLVPNLRHVLVTAAAIANLERLAPGRLNVAIGTGFTGRMMLGQRALPWKFVAQYIRDLRALLRGEIVKVEGRSVQMGQPDGYGSPRPIETPIIVAANGPKGLAVARELGDGIMCVAGPQPGFDRCALLSMGTVLEPGEALDSARVLDAIGPAIAVVYHGTWEANPEALDTLPGGREWRAEIEKIPEAVRHLAVHKDHLVKLTDLDRRFISPQLAGVTLTGEPDHLRDRLAALKNGGCTEVVYAPMGSDVPRELRAMAEVAGL